MTATVLHSDWTTNHDVYPQYILRITRTGFARIAMNNHYLYLILALPSNGEWKITSIKYFTGKTDHSNCCVGNYSTISYDITIARKPAYLLFYLTPPSLILGILTLMSFFIPTESGERIGFVTTILLSMMVFLLLIPEYLPDISDELPVLGVLMISFLILIAAVLMATIVILKCYHSQGTPSSITQILLCKFKSKSQAKKRHYSRESDRSMQW